MIGLDPRPFTLRRLNQMACGKWDFESGVLSQVLAAMFDKDAKGKNPFDTRAERPKTDAEIAELDAAKDRIERIRQRVNERKQQRES